MTELYHFEARIISPPQQDVAYWLIYCNDKFVFQQQQNLVAIPCVASVAELGLVEQRRHYLGTLNGVDCYTVEVAEAAFPASLCAISLRQTFDEGGEQLFTLASRAYQVIQWDKNHQFCGRCGCSLTLKDDERAKVCPQCQLFHYPRISPSIIVLIMRGDELLLARSPHFRPGVFSAIAGFVEPGESAEEAIHREVREEIGVKIDNVRYIRSQSWPFPDSLMLGYFADYLEGEIKIDAKEIEAAAWFHRTKLPPLPNPISISRKLIDHYLKTTS